MTPISGWPRADRRHARSRAAGFTLLEMAVSLAVLALASALVAPSISRMADGWRNESEMTSFRTRLRGLPSQARKAGREIVIETNASDSARYLQLPDEWSLRMAPALVVQQNGVCRDARGEVQTPSGAFVVEVKAPFCEAEIAYAP